jgi:putative transport protein
MTESLVRTFAQYPILTLFVVVGLGYLAGELEIAGFRLGVSGVLFVGLAIGSLGPDVALPEIVPALGLIIFVYAVGIHSGRAFFDSFKKEGYRNSLLTVGVLVLGAALAVVASNALKLGGPRAAGLFCGALTNTPALAAARDRITDSARARGLPASELRSLTDQPVVAYSVAYPIGVIGVLLCFQLARRLWGLKVPPAEEAPEIQARDFVVANPGITGHTVSDVLRVHKDVGFVVSRIRHEGRTDLAKSDTLLSEGDIVVVVGDEEALERARQIFGAPADARLELDRSELDYRRFFVSSKKVVGRRIQDLDLQNRLSATITRLRRGDVDVVPRSDTRLELGDVARVLTRKENFQAVSRFFGDSLRGTAETDFGSVAIGMVLGVMVGMLPIPLPGGTTVTLGLAGGPLLVALVLGNLERSGRVTWIMPAPASLSLRQIGLLLFLAGVGVKAGYSFAGTMRSNGAQMLAAGAVITFGVTMCTIFIGHRILKIPFDALMGLASGVQTQPACLAYATGLTRSDAPNIAYAGVYPTAMIAKIILAQLLVSS